MDYAGDVAAIIVNRNRPDLTDRLVEQIGSFASADRTRVFVIECGSDPDKRSRYATFSYDDEDFRGKCYGHERGLDYVLRTCGRFRYYWILMNDLVFAPEPDPVAVLTETLEREPRMGIISPSEPDSGYPGARPRPGQAWHVVCTCDYLALMIKDACLREVGFLNPDFKYCWGAIHELSYKLYRSGWFMAYSDRVSMKHLGGTTYGAAAKTISRSEYQERAKEWAARYFVETYGQDWDDEFSRHLPDAVEVNTYRLHRKFWEEALRPA